MSAFGPECTCLVSEQHQTHTAHQHLALTAVAFWNSIEDRVNNISAFRGLVPKNISNLNPVFGNPTLRTLVKAFRQSYSVLLKTKGECVILALLQNNPHLSVILIINHTNTFSICLTFTMHM